MAGHSQHECMAIIPARGGSKGIPRKNLREIAGKPLVAYSIEHALHTPGLARVVVSTDDEEIGAVARQYGAEVVWRPADISGDEASSEAALLHVLDTLREAEGYDPDLVVFLQPTSPLRQPGAIAQALETLHRQAADSLLSVCPMHGCLWRREAGGPVSFSYDHRHRPRRQDAPQDFVENGSIYVFKPWVLRQEGNRLGGKIALFPMPVLDSFQVDEPEDLDLMEQLLAVRPPASASLDLKQIQLLVLDFDGVLTDNRVWVDQEGREAVSCHRGDGWGIARLKEAGVEVLVLSTEENPVVAARCAKLRIPCRQGCRDKLSVLRQIAHERMLEPEAVAFVGNDVNDLACLRWVGTPIVVADAEPAVKPAACLITRRRGGSGAVREVCDLILSQKNAGSYA